MAAPKVAPGRLAGGKSEPGGADAQSTRHPLLRLRRCPAGITVLLLSAFLSPGPTRLRFTQRHPGTAFRDRAVYP
jgi:hypothetical protein